MRRFGAWLAPLVFAAGCTPRLIDLRADGPASVATEADQGLNVITSIGDGCDPLRVHGQRLVFEGLRDVLDRSITAAARNWAVDRRATRADGWELLVEPLRCDAESEATNLAVQIEVRVTARTRLGRIHLGQSQAFCKDSGTSDGDGGKRVLFRCVDQMARDISGWLDNLSP